MNEEKEYECKKELILDKRDENEVLVENESFVVPVGSAWYKCDYSSLSDIRLQGDLGWVEIDKKTLDEHFSEI